ncbi:flagellar hook-basal body complex protein [Coprothermobacteraceae bacterium]|nr:flagellar hook-basal body complex protein [Coprothermobacteraceae bacterium]
MLRGIYNAVSSDLMLLRMQGVIEENLLHLQTPGYKQRSFAATLVEERNVRGSGRIALGNLMEYPFVTATPGQLEQTGRALDLAVSGGYVAVDTGTQKLWASSLSMLVDDQGYLVSPEGYRVLGRKGPVKWEEGMSIDERGNIVKNGETVDQLLISNIEVEEVVQDRYFVGNEVAGNFKVYSGYLEQSTVDEVEQMTLMIQILRQYQANARVIQSEDAALSRLINLMA